MGKPGYVANKPIKWKGEQIKPGQVVPGIEDHPNLYLFKQNETVVPYFEWDGQVKDPDNLLEGVADHRLEADDKESVDSEQEEELTFDDLNREGPWYKFPDGDKAKGEEKAKEMLAQKQ